ncbi:hypothetical protein EFT87_11665 [Schleiferilactobacillus harbinensis]|uniref:GH36 C-terminal domain-containing protein n=1 Tax=Schleiferilactobacillus harbinensis TaxID=304207 RepID=UPI0021A479DA|nr:GH36 C-terminal domain-containing protein [Schleiferilactobacillus harbinensis]MCT2909307.1 hypothetical protein [Schleiferilactobacillus harbinensis]
MFVSAEQSEVLLFTFHLSCSAQPTFHVTKMVWLNPPKGYEDTATHTIYGGDELMNIGLYQPVAQADFSTQRYHFKAIQ